MAYSPSSVQEAWDNHFAAFGGQDVDKIMLDYDDNSVAYVHNTVTGVTDEHKGLFGIRTMFVGLFADLSDLKTLEAPVVKVEEVAKQVFLVWKCPGVGFESATDTFIFSNDKKFKVVRQNIVVTKRDVVAPFKPPAREGAPYEPKSVQDAWDNHFAAFGGQDLDKIMLDYTDASVAHLHNNVTGTTDTFKGMAKIREMFTNLFADLKELSTLTAPVVTVEEDGKQVFLVWKCPGCGYDNATDTFIFGDDFKVTRQNIVVTKRAAIASDKGYAPKSVQEAWDNHFAAFGGKDVDKILLDYDENSVARVHNNVTLETAEFKGLAKIREMFTGLFADLKDLSTLSAPVVTVEELAKQVFLVWRCPGCQFDTATDTFIFGNDFKINRQNIVVTQRKAVATDKGYAPKSVQEAWDNHFAAFGGQDVDKIMLDYDETSVARLHNNTDGSTADFVGLAKIREMFTSLFADLKDLATLTAPVITVEEEAKQVFLVWKCPGCGYDTASDTFIFGNDFKVKRQNIVVTKKAA